MEEFRSNHVFEGVELNLGSDFIQVLDDVIEFFPVVRMDEQKMFPFINRLIQASEVFSGKSCISHQYYIKIGSPNHFPCARFGPGYSVSHIICDISGHQAANVIFEKSILIDG